jgi:hypothetical protein
MEQVTPLALTTLARVKDLLFDPSLYITVNATTANGSNSLSNTVVQTGKVIRIGQSIAGPGIPAGAYITAVSVGTLTISANATAGGTGVALVITDQSVAFDTVLTRMINYATDYIHSVCGVTSFVQQTYLNDTYSIDNGRQDTLILRNTPVFSISSFQYRAGTPSNPSWTAFTTDQYELINPRTDPISGLVWYPSGMLRVYGVLPTVSSNTVRATYVAGYPVNWANAEDRSTHMLPGDLTSVCENLVVRRFKRRSMGGQSSHALEGATTSWRNDLDAEDKDVLAQYKDLHF